jgi:hypothetical protein
MRYLCLWLCVAVTAAFLIGCDDDSGCVCFTSIRGQVLMQEDETPVGGASVFLIVPEDDLGRNWATSDSAITDMRGKFLFSGLEAGSYRVYAGLDGAGGPSRFSHVSRASQVFDLHGRSTANSAELILQAVTANGSLFGQIRLAEQFLPVDSARVELYRLEGADYVRADTTFSNTNGEYGFEDVCTGHYRLLARKELLAKGPFTLYGAESADFFCEGEGSQDMGLLLLIENDLVRKPAIYIYPEQAGQFEVQLRLHGGIELTRSIPEYGDGWDVHVETSGRIEGRYDYLFYEAAGSMTVAPAAGWCLRRDDLAGQLPGLLAKLGLNERESADFLEYWLDALGGSPYYKIYPVVQSELDPWVELSVKPRPDSLLRFWLFFKGCNDFEPLVPYPANGLERSGTTVVEWGGVLVE